MRSLVLLISTLMLTCPAQAEDTEPCVNYAKNPRALGDLEELAGRGALGKGEIGCLETSYMSAVKITTKDKISRVLLINAYAYNTNTWATLVDRHLQEIDRSDPAIAYLYTFYLFNRAEPNFDLVITWADVALERRSEWKGNTHINRTLQLMKVRTICATRLWSKAASEGNRERAEEHRLSAKTNAREWMDFAQGADRPSDEAALLCISAASAEACGIKQEN